jgi:hypothetical protein
MARETGCLWCASSLLETSFCVSLPGARTARLWYFLSENPNRCLEFNPRNEKTAGKCRRIFHGSRNQIRTKCLYHLIFGSLHTSLHLLFIVIIIRISKKYQVQDLLFFYQNLVSFLQNHLLFR